MRSLILFVLILVQALVRPANSQPFYNKSFGDKAGIPLIFMHGGPGGTSLDFELTTAPVLAQNGFFVIVYDRRGEGRSLVDSADFKFSALNQDLLSLYKKYNIEKAALLGHSFGGVAASIFAQQFPEKVTHLLLTAAPFVMQQSFDAILENSGYKGRTRADSTILSQVRSLQQLDRGSIQFSAGCFMLAMQAGLYQPENPSIESTKLYELMLANPKFTDYGEFLKNSNYQTVFNPSMGFWKNEKYTSLDISDSIFQVRQNNIPVYGIYGKEDGLFTNVYFKKMKDMIGEDNFRLLDNCGHAAYIEQQQEFIRLLNGWLKP